MTIRYLISCLLDCQIGEYSNGSLVIQNEAELKGIKPSECGQVCLICLATEPSSYTYIHGNFIIIGLFSLHKTQSITSFQCGDYRGQSSSTVALLAFLQVIQMLSPKGKIVEGGKFLVPRVGALVLDDCYSPLKVSSLLSDVFTRKTTFTDNFMNEVSLRTS